MTDGEKTVPPFGSPKVPTRDRSPGDEAAATAGDFDPSLGSPEVPTRDRFPGDEVAATAGDLDPALGSRKVPSEDRSSVRDRMEPVDRGRRRRGGPMIEISRLAGDQDGVVARREILAAGIGQAVIKRQLAAGRLRCIYRGVYSIGHTELSDLGRWRAALLLGGAGARLSHTSAAQIHRLIDDGRFADQGMIHVTKSSGGRHGVRPACARRQPAAHFHRARSLRRQDVVRRRGLTVTSVDRTLIDLAGMLSRRRLESAVLQAQRLSLLDTERLAARLRDPMPGREGIAALRDLIHDATPLKARTLSDPEAWMLDLLDRCGLPEPEVNEWVEGIMVDFYWREAQLIVEFDGHAFHSTREALRRDKRRDRHFQLAGFMVLRYTYEDLTDEPDRVAAEITDALESRLRK